jgi:hypothetical protein
MSITSLVPSFTEVATNLASTIASEAGSLIATGIISGLTGWWAAKRAMRSMSKYDYSEDETYIKEFFFERTDKTNPETGNNFHVFKLRAHEQIDLEKVFGQSIRSEVANRIIKASEQCTTDSPVVFEFLKSVYDRPKLLQRIINVSSWLTNKLDQSHKVNLLIENVDEHWTNFFGGLATPERSMLRDLPKHTSPQEVLRFPILVYESESKKRFHILWLNEDQLNPDYYPNPQDVLLEKDSEESYLPLIHAVVDRMADPENAFIRTICCVPIPWEEAKYTGHLADPQANCP